MQGPTHTIATPTARPGAIGVVSIHAEDMDAAIATLGLEGLGVGEVRLADLLGVDRGLAIRWSAARVDLTPHGGRLLIRRLSEALEAAGVRRRDALPPERMYPEAATPLEARMLDALSRAASPRAIDLLLDQPRRWRGISEEVGSDALADAAALSRLLEPPLVVAAGAPNIGKSTLVNALAGRGVSIVADEPGVTRDCVGVMLELDGLAVRYLDAPGLGVDEPEGELAGAARRAALDCLRAADLVILCADATAPPPEPGSLGLGPSTPILRVATRADLGPAEGEQDARVCATRGEGLGQLARAVRRALVPDAALDDPRPWRFWDRPGAGP